MRQNRNFFNLNAVEQESEPKFVTKSALKGKLGNYQYLKRATTEPYKSTETNRKIRENMEELWERELDKRQNNMIALINKELPICRYLLIQKIKRIRKGSYLRDDFLQDPLDSFIESTIELFLNYNSFDELVYQLSCATGDELDYFKNFLKLYRILYFTDLVDFVNNDYETENKDFINTLFEFDKKMHAKLFKVTEYSKMYYNKYKIDALLIPGYFKENALNLSALNNDFKSALSLVYKMDATYGLSILFYCYYKNDDDTAIELLQRCSTKEFCRIVESCNNSLLNNYVNHIIFKMLKRNKKMTGNMRSLGDECKIDLCSHIIVKTEVYDYDYIIIKNILKTLECTGNVRTEAIRTMLISVSEQVLYCKKNTQSLCTDKCGWSDCRDGVRLLCKFASIYNLYDILEKFAPYTLTASLTTNLKCHIKRVHAFSNDDFSDETEIAFLQKAFMNIATDCVTKKKTNYEYLIKRATSVEIEQIFITNLQVLLVDNDHDYHGAVIDCCIDIMRYRHNGIVLWQNALQFCIENDFTELVSVIMKYSTFNVSLFVKRCFYLGHIDVIISCQQNKLKINWALIYSAFKDSNRFPLAIPCINFIKKYIPYTDDI